MQEIGIKTASRVQINGEELDIILLPMRTPAGCKVYECGCVHNLAIDKWGMCEEHKYILKHVIRDFEQDMRIKKTVFDIVKIKNIVTNIVNNVRNYNYSIRKMISWKN